MRTLVQKVHNKVDLLDLVACYMQSMQTSFRMHAVKDKVRQCRAPRSHTAWLVTTLTSKCVTQSFAAYATTKPVK